MDWRLKFLACDAFSILEGVVMTSDRGFHFFGVAGLLLLTSACAGGGDDPDSADRRRCRSDGEVVRMQVEQQEANSAARVPTITGAMAPIGSSSGGFSAYRAAYAECMRARTAERAQPASTPKP